MAGFYCASAPSRRRRSDKTSGHRPAACARAVVGKLPHRSRPPVQCAVARSRKDAMDVPATMMAATVIAYWLGIGVMIVRVRRHTHRMAGVVPEQRLERFMWLAWLPLAAAWIALPWITQRHD